MTLGVIETVVLGLDTECGVLLVDVGSGATLRGGWALQFDEPQAFGLVHGFTGLGGRCGVERGQFRPLGRKSRCGCHQARYECQPGERRQARSVGYHLVNTSLLRARLRTPGGGYPLGYFVCAQGDTPLLSIIGCSARTAPKSLLCGSQVSMSLMRNCGWFRKKYSCCDAPCTTKRSYRVFLLFFQGSTQNSVNLSYGSSVEPAPSP